MDFPNQSAVWRHRFAYEIPYALWPNNTRLPANIQQLIDRYDFEWLLRRWPGVPRARWMSLRLSLIAAIQNRREAVLRVERGIMQRRPATGLAFRVARNLPFHTVDDNVFLEAVPGRASVVRTRRGRAQAIQDNIRRDEIQVPPQSRYTSSTRFTITPNNLELLENLLNVYDSMANIVLQRGSGHHYRIRIVWQLQERQVQRVTRQSNVLRSIGEFMDMDTFKQLSDTVANMFISNELINVFDMEFFLDSYVYNGGGGTGSGGHGGRKRTIQQVNQKSLKSNAGEWKSIGGLFYIPNEMELLCGWLAATAFMLLNDTENPEGWLERDNRYAIKFIDYLIFFKKVFDNHN